MHPNGATPRRPTRQKSSEQSTTPVQQASRRSSQPTSHVPPSKVSALQNSEDERHCGVFVFINGLLCRTADNTGRFCPRDVFSCVDRVSACGSLPIPSPTSDKVHHSLLRDSSEAEVEAVAVESDCPVFNAFGVVSGGVLINPFDGTFADVSQSTPYTVSSVKASACRTATHLIEHRREVEEQVRTDNELAFRQGAFHRIRPETAMTLCAAELTLPPPAPLSANSTVPLNVSSFSQPRRRCTTSAVSTSVSSLAAAEKWYANLALPDGVTPREAKIYKTTWQEAEAFRHSLNNDCVLRATVPQNFFPPAIPFLYRECGVPLRLDREGLRSTDDGPQGSGDAETLEDAFAIPTAGVRTPASCFVCYSGQPRFSTDSFNPTRQKLKTQRVPPLVVRLQKRLRPYDVQNTSDSTQYAQEKLPGARQPSAKVMKQEARKVDVREFVLTPYSSDRPRDAAFHFFQVYFNHLGILCDGRRVTGETEATSVPQRPSHSGEWTWGLCSDGAYDVQEEVHRKQSTTTALWEDPKATFPGGSRWSTTASNLSAVLAAYTTLITSNRDALLRRIHAINRQLHTRKRDAPVRAQ